MEDNKDIIINCPACGKPMKKIYMPSQGFNLDVCVDGCGGIYFDNREFSKFDEPREDISPLIEVLKDKQFLPVNTNAERICPVCGTVMIKNFSNHEHNVEIDECYRCGGRFLDYGEIDKIRAEFGTEAPNPAELVKSFYEEAGIDTYERPELAYLASQAKQLKYKNMGFLVGFILSFIWLIKNWGFMQAYASNQPGSQNEFFIILLVALAIILICTSIGSLIGKVSK